MYVDFFDRFVFEGKKCEIALSADSQYAIYVNGQFVDAGQYADYPEYKVFDTVDLTPYLREGENELLITAYWHGTDGMIYRLADPGLLYTVTGDGEVLCVSDESTLARRHPAYHSGDIEMLSGQLLYTYAYDSTADMTGGWRAAEVQEKAVSSLYPRPIQKLEILPPKTAEICAKGIFFEIGSGESLGLRLWRAALSAQELEEIRPLLPDERGYLLEGSDRSDGVYAVVDLGREETGYFQLSIETEEPCEILIGHGEHLEDLRVRSYIGGRNFCARYQAHAGKNEFFYPFKRMGARYIQLHAYTKKLRVHYVGMRPTYYPVSTRPSFSCADHLHNRIYEISKHTLHMCMHEHYEDCPWREQGLYSMDSRTQMLCGYYAFGEFDFAKSSIRLMALSLREDAMLEICSPARHCRTIPSFTAIFPVLVEEYLLHSRDTVFVSEIFDVLEKICAGFVAKSDENGLVAGMPSEGYWNFYEWQNGYEGWVEDQAKEPLYAAPLNAMISMAFTSFAKVCDVLDRPQLAAEYRQRASERNAAIHRYFWNAERGLYDSYCPKQGEPFHRGELTQALCVLCGASVGEERGRVLKQLASGAEDMFGITLSHSIFKFEALMQEEETYAPLVFEMIADTWGKMVYRGATSFWETETGDRAFGNAGSLCHGWSAVPVYFYYRYALGYKVETDRFDLTYAGLHDCKGQVCLGSDKVSREGVTHG